MLGEVPEDSESVLGVLEYVRDTCRSSLLSRTRNLLQMGPQQIGKAKVAYPAIKRLLIHIFAL